MAILEALGMQYETTLKYVLSHSPGANRLDAEGRPETKNYCMIGGAIASTSRFSSSENRSDSNRRQSPKVCRFLTISLSISSCEL
jgi:hypothetical protein